MKPISPAIFRAYDIRGVVDRDLDPEWVETLGRACGTAFRRRGLTRAVIGHDCRLSSPSYQEAMARGLAASSIDVILLDMVPTPVFYWAVKTLGTQAGVMITASHNPPEYNGFKVWAGETTLWGDGIRELYEIMAAADFATDRGGQGLISHHDVVPAYLDDLAGHVSAPLPLKVVVDGGNGAGGLILTELLKRVGVDVVPLYCEPDGRFPNHHPDPVVEAYISDLKARVLAEGAHLGIGLDGDADRLGVVDETGRLMYGDRVLALFARDLLARNPGATVMAEVKCSHLLYRDIATHGGNPVMGVTGHSVMKAAMLENGALLAGEMSGHMFFAERYHGFDDAIYAALVLCEILGRDTTTPLSRRLDDWPVTYNTPEIRVDCPDEIKFQVVAKAQEHFRREHECVDIDGVRLVYPDGWGLVRASNTQPSLVLRFEAESPERLVAIRRDIEEPLGRWIKELADTLA